jgi:hypothetical protein
MTFPGACNTYLVPLLFSLYKDPSVDDAPAENQLCEVPGCDIIPVFKDGNRVNPCLLFDAVLKFFDHMFAQFSIYYHLPHLVPIMFFRQKFE